MTDFKIPLRNKIGDIIEYAIVDEDIYDRIKDKKWHLSNGYVKTHIDKSGVFLHRYILNAKIEDQRVDHINNNKLDNRVSNLRFVTASQNAQNRVKKDGCTSNYVGVTKSGNSWNCTTGLDKCTYKFKNEIHAAYWYDVLVVKHYGSDAKSNKLEIPEDFIEPTNGKMKTCVKKEDIIKKEDIVRNNEGVAIIKIAKSDKYILVDDDKYYELLKYYWHLTSNGYAQSTEERKKITMHRYLMNAKEGDIIDHINNDRLDNRVSNLRFSSHALNSHNVSKQKNTLSKYLGVTYDKLRGKFVGVVIKDKEQFYCGGFDTEEDAAKARDLKALELYGSYANLNFKDQILVYEKKLNIVRSELKIKLDSFHEHYELCKRSLKKRINTSSNYIGVTFDKSRNKYMSGLITNGEQFNCGRFDTEEKAAKARVTKTINLYGEFLYSL